MGNHHSSSCFMTLSVAEQTAKLFDAQGNLLRQVKLPLKAAELMLEEEPGHVISPAEDLRRTGRFCAMRAEDELLARKAYLLVPLCKVNRKVSVSDMAIVDFVACKKAAKKKNGGSKVSPAAAEETKEEDRRSDKDMVARVFDQWNDNQNGNGLFLGRPKGYLYIRGWKPALETIRETC